MRPKKVPISPGVVFKAEDIPESPDPRKQKQYRPFVAKLQFVMRPGSSTSSIRRLCRNIHMIGDLLYSMIMPDVDLREELLPQSASALIELG